MNEIELLDPSDKLALAPETPVVTDVERRRFKRKPMVNRTLYGLFRHLTDRLVDVVIERPFARGVLVLVALASITAVWWTIHYRVNSLELNQQHVAERAQLAEHLDQLKETWSDAELETVLERIRQAESRIFPGYADLAAWLSQTHRIAEAHGLLMQYQLSSALPSNVKDVLEVPISMGINADSVPADEAYLRVLQFVERLIQDRWYLEIHSAGGVSDGKGLRELALELRVWVHGATSQSRENDEEVTE